MNKENQQCKDVYAYFGLAVYSSQGLEQAMITLITLLDILPKYHTVELEHTKRKEIYDKFINDENKRTMGALLGRLQALGIKHTELEKHLKDALKVRNWLVHSYFNVRVMEFMNEKGRKGMITELIEIEQKLTKVEDEVHEFQVSLGLKYGITEDVIEKRYEALLQQANSDL